MPLQMIGGGGNGSIISPLVPAPLSETFTDHFLGTSLHARWTAAIPANVSVSGGMARLVANANGFYTDHLYLAGDARLDGRFTVRFAAGGSRSTAYGLIARRNASGGCYVVRPNDPEGLKLYSINNAGGVAPIASKSVSGFDLAATFSIRLTVAGVSPTLLLAELLDANGNIVQATHATDNLDQLQVPGSFGMAAWDGGGATAFDSATLEAQPLPARRKGIVCGYLGDSITAGAGSSGGNSTMPMQASIALRSLTGLPVFTVIQAVGGRTTANWLEPTNLAIALTAFRTSGCNHVSISLGTNDAKNSAPVSTTTYLANLRALAEAFLAIPGMLSVTLNAPPYHGTSPDGDFSGTSLLRVLDYADKLPTICTGSNGRGILPGDTQSFNYFAGNPELLPDTIHPNDAGAAGMGGLIACAIARNLGIG